MEKEIREAIQKNVQALFEQELRKRIEDVLPIIAAQATLDIMRFVKVETYGSTMQVTYSVDMNR